MTSLTTAAGRPNPALPYRFHRLAHTSLRYRWWRPLAGFVTVLSGALLVLSIPVAVIDRVPDLPGLGPLTPLALDLAQISLILPIVLVVTRWIGARPAGTVLSVTGWLRWPRLLLYLALALPITIGTFIAGIVLTVATRQPTTPATSTSGSEVESAVPHIHLELLGQILVGLVVIGALAILQSATEETMARGAILQAVGAYSRNPWPAIAVPALLFTVLHGPGTVGGYTDLIGYSMLIGWLTVATGGLEAAIAVHAVNNLLPAGSAVIATLLFRVDLDQVDNSRAGASWHMAVVHLLGTAVYTLAVWLINSALDRQYRRPPHLTLPAPGGTTLTPPTTITPA